MIGDADLRLGWQLQAERLCQNPPILQPVRNEFRPGQGIIEEHPASHPRESQPALRSQDAQQEVIPRIPSRGEANVEGLQLQSAEMEKLLPGPAKQPIFVAERRPGRDEGNYLHLRPESRLKVQRVRFGQQRDSVFLAGGLEKRGGDHQIPQSPELHYQQLRL